MRWSSNKNRSTPDDLAAEMAQHLEEKIEALIESGMDRREATAKARCAFGNQALLQDRSYAVWQGRYIAPIVADFKFAWRQLSHAPFFTTAAVLILGLGIAANTSVFSLLYAITQRDLPVPYPAELAMVDLENPAATQNSFSITYPIYEQIVQRQQSFTGLAVWRYSSATMLDAYGDLRSRDILLVTGNFFDVLRVHPALGRMLNEADDVHPDAKAAWPVVLDYAFWKENFHGDRGILGRTITLSQGPAVVVGVAEPSFEGLLLGYPLPAYLPLHYLVNHNDTYRVGPLSNLDPLHNSMMFGFHAIGRLKPGVSLQDADREMNGYTADIFHASLFVDPANTPLRGASLHAASGQRFLPAGLKRYSAPLTSLQVIMAIVLFLCCFNVTGLQLARMAVRRHEFAVRIALGAGRVHLIRQSLTEAVMLSLAGAALGAPIAWTATSALSGFLTPPGEAYATHIPPDWSIFALAAALAALATLVIGVVPALVAGRTIPAAELRARTSRHRSSMLASRVLVPLQIALSFLLVVVTGLLLATLVHLRDEDMGFDLRHVVEANTQLYRTNDSPAVIRELYRRIVHELRTEPGIEGAGITWITPMMGALWPATVQVANGAAPLAVDFNQVGPGYFDTLQIARLSGRDFNDGDTQRGVCIVNRAAEQMLYHGRPALDGDLMVNARENFSGVLCRIVGVVQDTRYADLRASEGPVVYFPVTAETLVRYNVPISMVILMRSKDDGSAADAYRRVMAKIAPSAPLGVPFPLRAQKNELLGAENLLTLMCLLFGGFALPLCGVGMFGLLAARVEQQTTEIAVRLTLGASRMQVLRRILRESMALLAAGLLLGVPLLLAMAVLGLAAVDQFLHIPALDFVADFEQHFLYATTRLDVYNILGAILLLTLVALTAGLFPGWRASRLDPLHVLRQE